MWGLKVLEHLVIVITNTALLVVVSAIEITQGPQDVTVEEGQSASFPCFYNGTPDIPTWIISGFYYLHVGFPDRHTYSNQIMTVHDVQVSDNGTTYQCGFVVINIFSSIATLTVIPGISHDCMSIYWW